MPRAVATRVFSSRKGRRWRSGLAALVLAGVASAAAAGEAQDRLFAMGVLDGVETGQTLVYDFERRGSFPADKLTVVDHGTARLEMKAGADGGREAIVALDDTRKPETYDPFPATAGNPMFMVFMEQNVNAMAAVTGGSPFYIRNRMREALGSQNAVEPADATYAGATVPARQLTFRPFATDPNRARMGAFGDLEIRFLLSDAVPGGLARMESVAGPGADGEPVLRLSVNLDRVEKED